MPTYIDDPVLVVRDVGSTFVTRKPAEDKATWIVYAGSAGSPGTENWKAGIGLFAALAPQVSVLGEALRVFFEFDGARACGTMPVGVMLCTPGSHISITAQEGKLVIRNESISPDHIIAVIDHDGIRFPQRVAPIQQRPRPRSMYGNGGLFGDGRY